MRRVAFFHKVTGELHRVHVMVSDDEAVALNTPADYEAIDEPADGSSYDHLSQKVDVDTGKVIDFQPESPSSDHEWDTSSRRWKLSDAAQDKVNADRAARNRIAFLEREQQPRAVREALLGGAIGQAAAKLKAIDDEICELRRQLTPPS